ncbi:MAG: hypothetical protein JWR39_1370 [Devosia sp.]|nr:hypothetical protein [Devosia sp.]
MNNPVAQGTVIAVVGLGLTLGAAYAAWQESSAYLSGSGTVQNRMLSILAGERQPGLATKTRLDTLNDCRAAIGSFAEAYLAPAERETLRSTCREWGEAVVAEAPASSFGWALLAFLRGAVGDSAGRNAALARSQGTGPYEAWIATYRVGLATPVLAELDQAASAALDADLQVLASSFDGLQSLAQRYATHIPLRERITAAVETLPDDRQSYFLAQVKTALGGQGAAP